MFSKSFKIENYRKPLIKRFLLGLFFSTLIAVVISCQIFRPPQKEDEQIKSGSVCFFPFAESFATPTLTSSEVPAFEEKTKFLFILIDRSSSYRAYAQKSLDLLSVIAPEIIDSGDRFFIGWIGVRTDSPEEILFLDIVATPQIIDTFNLPSTPVPFQLIPTGTVDPNLTTIGLAQQRAMNIEIEKSNAEKYSEYGCEVTLWNQTVASAIAQLLEEREIDQQSKIQNFAEKLSEVLSQIQIGQLEPATHIYEGLYMAARMREKSDSSYSRNILLIFSDMMETRFVPKDLPTDLTGFDIIVANFYCPQVSSCISRQKEWEAFFVTLNANQPVLFIDTYDTTANTLIDHLR